MQQQYREISERMFKHEKELIEKLQKQKEEYMEEVKMQQRQIKQLEYIKMEKILGENDYIKNLVS